MTERDTADELRHCLTVVSGYLGLALESRAEPPDEELWVWLQRAADAAGHAGALLDAPAPLATPPPGRA